MATDQSGQEPSPGDNEGAAAPPDVVAAANAYYAREINKPEAARSRAQAGFGIASAAAVILITAGVVTKFQTLPIWVLVIGLATLLLWFATAATFLWAVSAPITNPPADLFPEGQQEAATFVELAVVGANWHAKRINDRLRWAVSAAAVAAVLTLLSLVLVVTISPTDPRTEVADLSLASKAFRTVSRICPASVVAPPPYNVILGAIDPNDTSDDVISLRLNSSECHGPSSIDVPRSEVRAIVTHDKCSLSQISLPSANSGSQTASPAPKRYGLTTPAPSKQNGSTGLGLGQSNSSSRLAAAMHASPEPSSSPTPPKIKSCGFYMSGIP